jgi:3-deoxy-D-manno-octulosonate 8-phosphate phosphatase (KDO 8-P phosphatase)
VNHLESALQKIKLVIFDVDGVLTDGKLFTSPDGGESKSFHVHDGQGINFLHRAGISTAVITGRKSVALERRAAELGIEDVFQGNMNKLESLNILLEKFDLAEDEVAYIGDDLPDLPVMIRVGVSVAVADARPEVRERATMVTDARGGSGAVREFCDLLLNAQGKWQPIVESFLA